MDVLVRRTLYIYEYYTTLMFCMTVKHDSDLLVTLYHSLVHRNI